MIRNFLCVAIILFTVGNIQAQRGPQARRIASLSVDMSRAANGIDIPVSINLDDITFLPDSVLILTETSNGGSMPVSFQIEQGEHRTLYWIVKAGSAKKRTYDIITGSPGNSTAVSATAKDGAMIVHAGNNNLLSYYFKTVYPPAGIDTA